MLLYEMAANMQPGEWKRVPTTLPVGKTTFKQFQTVSTPNVGSADGMGWTERLIEHNGTLLLPLMRDTFGKALAIMDADGNWRRIEKPTGWTLKSERRPFNRWFKHDGYAHFANSNGTKTLIGSTLRTPLDNPGVFEVYGIPVGDDQFDTVGNFSMCEGWGRHFVYSPGGKLRSWAEGELKWEDHFSHIPRDLRNSGYAGTVIFNPVKQEIISIGGQHFGTSPDISFRVLKVNAPMGDAEVFDAVFEDGSLVREVTAASSRFFYHPISGEWLMLYRDGVMYYSHDAKVWHLYEDLTSLKPWGNYEKYCPWTQLGDTDVLVMVSHIMGVWLHRLRDLDGPDAPEEPEEPEEPVDEFTVTPMGQFAASVLPGQCMEFPSPTLNARDSSGSAPFSAPPGSGGVNVLDWASMFDLDPKTLRFYIQGGRPREDAPPQKMIWYDAKADKWDSKGNWSGLGGGHIYRHTAVAHEIRKVLAAGMGGWKSWDIDTNTYVGRIPSPPSNIGGSNAGWQMPYCVIWHPGMGPKGSLIMANISSSRIVALDWETQTWSPVIRMGTYWTNAHMVGHYHPLTKEVILGHSSATTPMKLSIVSADKSHRQTAPAPLTISCGGSNNVPFVPHPTKRMSIAFDRVTKKVWSYDWDLDLWEDRGPIPAPFLLYNTIAGTIGDVIFMVARPSSLLKAFVYKPDF